MKKIYTRIFSMLLLANMLHIQTALAQEPPTPPTEYEEMSAEEFYEMAFGMLDPGLYSTGILYDRTLKSSPVSQLDGQTQQDPLTVDGWALSYKEIREANTTYSGLELPELDDDFFFTLMQIHDNNPTEEDLLVVPIGIMAFEYNEFKEDAIENGLIRIINDRHYDEAEELTENPYDQKILFAAAPLIGDFEAEQIRLTFDPDYLFTNFEQVPNMIKVRVKGESVWQELSTGQHITLQADDDSTLVVEVQVEVDGVYFLSEGKTGNNLYIPEGGTGGGEGSRAVAGTHAFDEVWEQEVDRVVTSSPYALKPKIRADIGVYYGCDDHLIRKPFILVTGYAPTKTGGKTNLKQLNKKLNTYNENGLIDYLHARSYDIFIVKFRFGSDHIQNNAALLEAVIDRINQEKQTNGSQYENIVMGWSLGALTASYTLSKMEYDYFHESYPKIHHSKLYLSSDGEHLGANIMVGAQHAAVSFLKVILDMPTPKEILLYHQSQTGNLFNPGQGAHHFRADYLAAINNTQHPFTNNAGFPAFTRNAGIAIGSNNSTPFNLSAGQLMFAGPGPVIAGFQFEHYRSTDNNRIVYSKQDFRCIVGCYLINFQIKKTDYSALSFDNAPGSTHKFHNIIAGTKAFFNLLFLFPPAYITFKEDCFVPSVSAIALNGSTSSNAGLNMPIDQYFYTAPGVTDPFYGYPHLVSSNPLSETPFHAVAGNPDNDFHHPENLKLELVNFLKSEIMADGLLLQNRRIGEYYPSYKADFDAQLYIRAGSHLSHRTQQEDFVVQSNADVNLLAKNYISLEPGFTAEAGCVLEAKIGEICTPPACRIASNLEESSPTNEGMNQIENSEVLDVGLPVFKVYPNPVLALGTVQLNLPQTTSVNLVIRDLQGRIVDQLAKEKTYQKGMHEIIFHTKNLRSGIYICELNYSENREVQKLIVW